MKLVLSCFSILILFSSCFRNSSNIFSNNTAYQKKQQQDSLLYDERKSAELLEIKKIDSIRVADSLAALTQPIIYDTVLYASILRTPCHGKCPHYEIRLYQSGLAEYIGYASVDKIGKYQCRLDSSVIEKIDNMANESGYFELEDFYPSKGVQINDFPMCVCCVRNQELFKIVYNRNDAPLNLIKFQNFLDNLFEDLDWKPIVQERQKRAGQALMPQRQ